MSARPPTAGQSSELVSVYIGLLGIMKETRITYNFFEVSDVAAGQKNGSLCLQDHFNMTVFYGILM